MFGPYLRKKVVLSHNRSNMLCMLITNKLRQQRSEVLFHKYIEVRLKCTYMASISRNGKRTYICTQIQNNVIKISHYFVSYLGTTLLAQYLLRELWGPSTMLFQMSFILTNLDIGRAKINSCWSTLCHSCYWKCWQDFFSPIALISKHLTVTILSVLQTKSLGIRLKQ